MSSNHNGDRYFYLLDIQFLGFRYHGWQKQINVKKTIQEMLNRTVRFICPETQFKTHACSRTDAMVSANSLMVELFIYKNITRLEEFREELNLNLPQDLRIKSIKEVDQNFSIISSAKKKEYRYFFSYGDKAHPFCAPFMTNFLMDLDIDKMKVAAKLFEGTHNFRRYCYRPTENKDYNRKMMMVELVENNYITASFLPEKSFCFRVVGEGFLRHQIRMMVGALVKVGTGELSLEELKDSLVESDSKQSPVGFVASASGLHLESIEFSE